MELVNKMNHPDIHSKIKPDDVFRYTDKILSTYGDTSILSDNETSQVPVERSLCD